MCCAPLLIPAVAKEHDPIFWTNRKNILDQLKGEPKTIFAYLSCNSNCPSISLEICKKVLNIANPIPHVRALNVLGVPVFFDPATSILSLKGFSQNSTYEGKPVKEVA